MKLLVISHDEESLSPQQAIEQAKSIYGAYSTVVALPSSNNNYAGLYFSAQTLIAERVANIYVDSKDKEYYNIAKEKVINEAIAQFREVLEEVILDTEEKINK